MDKASAASDPRSAFIETLAFHALAEIRCNHPTQSDTALCNCAKWAVTRASVQEAKEAWAEHVLDAFLDRVEPLVTPTESVLAHLRRSGTA